MYGDFVGSIFPSHSNTIPAQYWKKNRLPDLLCKVWYKRYVDVDWLPARTEFNSNWSIGKVISGVIRMFRYR